MADYFISANESIPIPNFDLKYSDQDTHQEFYHRMHLAIGFYPAPAACCYILSGNLPAMNFHS